MRAWELAKDTIKDFIADEALSHGASIAYYTLFAIAPVLLIIIAIAGLVFGRDAAEASIVGQLSGLMGESTAKALEEIVHKVGDREGGLWATVAGIGALILTATGVFGEVQSALNVIWKAKDSATKERRSTLGRLARARAASLGLVVTSGFLITVSLATSAALEALSGYLRGLFPGAEVALAIVDFVVSTLLIGFMFAAIYKVLPDKPVAWRDAAVGGVATALLFEGGKYVIALYIGNSDTAATYGAAGALVVLLLWIYYTAQIFLLGAEFTHVYAQARGSGQAGGRLGEAERVALQELAQDAATNVALATRRVARHRRLIEDLERQGHDARRERRTLDTMERVLGLYVEHRDRLRQDLGTGGGEREVARVRGTRGS
jgi:membrane protein